MKLREAIDRADRIRPNAVHQDDKRLALYKLECDVAEMMGEELPEWDPDDDCDLLMPDPHSEIYPAHLCAYIDWAQEETDLYQIDMFMANQTMAEAKAFWRRNVRQDEDIKIKGVFV